MNHSCSVVESDELTIQSLCKKVGRSSTIVGLGESTHGTKEFTIYRSEIVKNLVQRHNYRIFILEAEFIICTKINKYILTGEGNIGKLLEEIKLWPWNNQDFLELVVWMKEFNSKHKNDPIQFFGMDTQFYNNYLTSLKMNFPIEFIKEYSYGTIDSIKSHYPNKGKLILDIEESNTSPLEKIEALRHLSNEMTLENSKIDLTFQYYILARLHNYSLTKPKDLNVRDQNMSKLVELVHKKYQQKIIIWAHNGHVFRKNDTEANYITFGHHISQKYKNEYAVVGFDFKEGSFAAKSMDENERGKFKNFDYRQIMKTLASQIDFGNHDYKITDCSSLNSYYVNSIGAMYKNNPKDVKRFTSEVYKNKEFDFIFSIPKSSPSKLLNH